MSTCRIRVIGGPIPRDVRITVEAQRHDLIATVLATADDELRRELLRRGTGASLWNRGAPVIHSSAFDALQLEVVGGGQGKVVAILDADDKVSALVKSSNPSARVETILLLRPRSTLPPGIPRGPQSKVLTLAAPLVVPKRVEPRPPTPPPPKPDLGLRVIGGPIPKDVRIVIRVFRTTPFMDMFPLIHEKVELVVPLAVISSRYFNLYEFEILRHGKGKKRRALFAKDTPESIGLTSRVLYLEEKPIWQHIKRPLSSGGGGDSEEEDSDNLSDIRPPSATSTLRDRDADTPPETIGARGVASAQLHSRGMMSSRGLDDGFEAVSAGAGGWWENDGEQQESKGSRALTLHALKLRDQAIVSGGGASGIGKQILDLVAPENQHAQLIRVVGGPIPRTARIIVDALRTQTFMSLFPAIQEKVIEFIPKASITPYRYELVELQLLPRGKTSQKRALPLQETPWSVDFGLTSVILLREIPEGFLKGTEDDATALDTWRLPGEATPAAGTGEKAPQASTTQHTNRRLHAPPNSTAYQDKPSTATSLSSATTTAAPKQQAQQQRRTSSHAAPVPASGSAGGANVDVHSQVLGTTPVDHNTSGGESDGGGGSYFLHHSMSVRHLQDLSFDVDDIEIDENMEGPGAGAGGQAPMVPEPPLPHQPMDSASSPLRPAATPRRIEVAPTHHVQDEAEFPAEFSSARPAPADPRPSPPPPPPLAPVVVAAADALRSDGARSSTTLSVQSSGAPVVQPTETPAAAAMGKLTSNANFSSPKRDAQRVVDVDTTDDEAGSVGVGRSVARTNIGGEEPAPGGRQSTPSLAQSRRSSKYLLYRTPEEIAAEAAAPPVAPAPTADVLAASASLRSSGRAPSVPLPPQDSLPNFNQQLGEVGEEDVVEHRVGAQSGSEVHRGPPVRSQRMSSVTSSSSLLAKYGRDSQPHAPVERSEAGANNSRRSVTQWESDDDEDR